MDNNIYKRNLLVPFLKMVGDALAVEAAVLFSYYLRFYSPLTRFIPVTKGYPPFEQYLYFSFFLVGVSIVLFIRAYSYRSRFFSSFSQDIPVVLRTSLMSILVGMSAAFLYRGFSYSRLVFLLIFLNMNLFLLIERFVFHRIKRFFLTKGYNTIKVVLVGSVKNLFRVFDALHKDLNYNFQIAGYLANKPQKSLPLEYLGSVKKLPEVIESREDVDGLIMAFDHQEHPLVLETLKATEGKNIELFYIPDMVDILTTRVQVLEVAGLPLLQVKAFLLSGWQGFLKRTFDIVIASLGLILLSPLMLLIALLIKLTSPGPVLYKQPRVGYDGREFDMLKFRSMRVDAEAETGPVWAKKDDPRATSIGKILRRTSLDELPQLINVLKGEMSIVGPRPERRHFVEQFQKYIPQYRERHRVRCGMTGWAQVNGLRGQSPIEERTKYDLYYIENWSIWFDLKIIIMTFIEIIRGENAY
ncbi:MAG: undecaprenyl-phosphate glucose phosphotransferase [Calditrichaeota bacterium]|nr:MAG: undecaprenyl-phosphate glucose phosphotransferase [Calditrichota bacterium]